jgi:hypothetical protein
LFGEQVDLKSKLRTVLKGGNLMVRLLTWGSLKLTLLCDVWAIKLKSRSNSRNAYNHSFQNLLSSCLLSISMKIKIYTVIVIVPVVLYELFTLREEHRPRIIENRVLTRIFGPRRKKVTGGHRALHDDEL